MLPSALRSTVLSLRSQLDHSSVSSRASSSACYRSEVATGALTADEAILRVDYTGRLDALAHHAWRSEAELAGPVA